MRAGLSKKIITIFITVVISLLATEVLLRIFGTGPWKNVLINDSVTEKLIYTPDSTLGWKAKEGSYLLQPTNPKGKQFHLTIGKDGQRKTGENNKDVDGEILVIGGSFSLGWGVNDEDTFSSKLQKKYTNFKVYNFGQGGYGSVQSFLLLEKQIPKMKSPKLVIYGFIEHHEYRNVARSQWLRTLAKYSRLGTVNTPYGLIGKNNKLIINSPIGYINLPLKESSALITLFEKAYMKNISTKKFPRDSQRKKQQKLVTEETILQMKEISNKFDADFVLVILDWSNRLTKDQYEIFFKRNKIKFVNCTIPLIDEMVLLDDYHPSKKAHTYYNECLVDYIKEQKLIF